jgi:type II secretory pathway pseudopilin PulG
MVIGKVSICPANTGLGFSYIGLMIFVAIAGIALAGVGIVWSQDQQREREKELLFVGEQYRQAIGSYYENGPDENAPNKVKQYPNKLEDLLLDGRSLSVKRHLRKIYIDPITNSTNWGLERRESKIIGVYSLSELKPIKKKGFPLLYEKFSDFSKYADWKFIYTPTGANPVSEIAPS